MYVKSWNKKGLWVDVSLTEAEEEQAFSNASNEHIDLMHKCINTAKNILIDNKMHNNDSEVLLLAKMLFSKQAKHEQFYREDLARKLFESD